ncbi:MAG: hypothetical protein M3Q58_14935 [Bacteroidota bacterium]|nr:hypothetical protein [Bacteroidota bacterium]
MKKALFTFFTTVILFAGNASATMADLFNIDEEMFYNEISSLTSLDEYVSQNQGVTLSTIDVASFVNIDLIKGSMSVLNVLDEPPLGISSFIWGCCLGFPGIAIVYFITEDSEETMKALKGCIVSSIAGGVLYVVYVAFLISLYGY